MGAERLEIHKQTSDYAIASYGPVLLQLWQWSTPVDGAREARRAAQKLAARDYEKTGSLVIVPVQSSIPEKDAREQLSHLPADLSNGAGLVLVQEGTGFRASAVRAVLSTLMLVSRRSMPHDVVASVPVACRWLGRQMDIPGGHAGLLAAVGELRALYEVEGGRSALG